MSVVSASRSLEGVQAITFDVFGTVVDWRGTIIEEGQRVWRARGLDVDWAAFAETWRGMYLPAAKRMREGEIEFVKLSVLHRQNLDRVLEQFGHADFPQGERTELFRVWHRLRPWPDAVEGLTRLKSRYIIGPLSNGDIAMMVNMAKHGGLPWDVILGAEIARQYKPHPAAYLRAAQVLDLPPEQCMLVAAHNDDLRVAGEVGFQRAFVARPTEHGPGQRTDLRAEHDFEIVATDLNDLADRLGCD